MKINLDIASLSEDQIKKLKQTEGDIGATIVAYQKKIRPAKLNEDQLEKLRVLENELGVILIAFEN